MKNLMIMIVCLFSLVNTSIYADTYTVNKSGGNGAEYAKTTHTRDSDGNQVLDCTGTGTATCPDKDFGNSIMVGILEDYHTHDMLIYAESEINSGNTTGSHTANFIYNGLGYYRSVYWTELSLDYYQIIVTINEVVNPSN